MSKEVILELLNRRAVIIKPKATFADWVNSLPTHPAIGETHHEPSDLEEVRTCYLFPTSVPMGEEDAYLRQFKVRLLKEELAFQEDDQSLWTANLTPEQFDYYFDLEILPTVIDLEAAPVFREPFVTGL